MNRRNFIGLSTVAASLATTRGRANGDPSEGPILSFGLITDVQYADADPEGERHYRDSIQKLKVAVAWLATKKLPFTVHLGDLIDRDFQAFGTVLPLLDELEHPVYHLLGNHDYSVAEGQKEQVRSTLGMPHDYYSFKAAGVRFVMLDTNDLSVYKYPHGCPKDLESGKMLATRVAENDSSAKPWNGGLSATQLAWFERELSQADAAKERVIICGHHPLLPEDGYQLWNHQAVIDVMDRHSCVTAFFNGHQHAGAERIHNGVPYITFKSLLHQPEVTAFSAIRLYADRLEIEGKGREISRAFPLRKA
ncbi:MAG: metallophosphoesterase [Verrucomicrobiota bacterium]